MTSDSDTGLRAKLIREIRETGPITVARYMAACLFNPDFGYYRSDQVFGRHGDFITAPEISQIFGELLGLWTGIVWKSMGAPEKFNLIEFGPGRGTMLADALRALNVMPLARSAARVHLIERSEGLRKLQRETLAPSNAPLNWHEDLTTVPGGPTIILANEFLDALPIRQFAKSGGTWHERLISVAGPKHLQFSLETTQTTPPAPPDVLAEAGDGDIIETRNIPDILLPNVKDSGHGPVAALFIDYGHLETATGDSFQAVSNHRYVDPLRAPGTADLTAHVDFMAFSNTMRGRGYVPDPPVPQGEFLAGMGIIERAGRLAENCSTTERNELETAVARLIAPDGMGTKFKAMALRSPDCPPLPNFPSNAAA